MKSVGEQRNMRVTVRGRFDDLSDRALDYLRSNLDLHDVSNSEYTAEGVLTYDAKIDYFSLRYRIRLESDDLDDRAVERGMSEAEQFLRVMGFHYRDLGVSVTDVSAAWSGPEGSELPPRP
jgi:Family of unknown function (DUF6204)